MSSNFKANPVVASNFTRPGESSEYTGTRNITGLLPSIFKTSVNTQFLKSTLEQLMTSGSLQTINSYVGSTKRGMPSTDRYVDSVSNDQFVPGVINKDIDNNITGTLTYDDMLNALKFNDAQIEQPNRAFNEPGYTLDLPINYDMFINFHKYFWLIDYIPACILEPTISNPINIDDIIGQVYYTTPELENGKTLEFRNGMRVSFTGSNSEGTAYDVDALYIVDGVGSTSGITLTKQYEASFDSNPFGNKIWSNDTVYRADYTSIDYADTIAITDFATREYVVEERNSRDQSAWSRTNMWVKESVVHLVCDYNNLSPADYTLDGYRATRPIIEYRSNIEKFNFGKNHILNVSHMLDSIPNPAVNIEGQANWDLASQTITNEWENTGYNRGAQVKVTKSATTTYWDCVETHAIDKLPTAYENRRYWRQITSTPLTNNDTILFVNTTEEYKDKIFIVSGVGSSISLTLLYSPDPNDAAFTIFDGDKILTIHGYNSVFLDSYDGAIYSGSEWHWDGYSWVYSQQKEMRNGSLLFNLYDTDATAIDDNIVYPLSDFTGDVIFDYARGSGKVDEGLGFAPEYVDYGNNPGFRFNIGLGAVRYFYNIINTNETYQPNHDASTVEEIKGYYYYKRLDNDRYYNGWVNLRNQQPVTAKIRHVISNVDEVASFDINTVNINLHNKYRFLFNRTYNLAVISENTLNENSRYIDINGTNPVLFMSKEKTYLLQTEFDNADLEFVNIDGSPLSGVTRTPIRFNEFSLDIAADITVNAFMYRLVSNNDVKGVVYINNETATTNLKVYINGVESTDYSIIGTMVILSSTYPTGTVIDLEWYTNDILTNPSIEYSVADTHIMNPQNDWLTSVTYGDLQLHIKSQMTNIPGFTGDYFGTNNYDMLPHVHEFGGTIRKQAFSTELLAQTLMDVDTNPFSALSYCTQQYGRFKEQVIQKVTQLHNTTPIETPVFELVDMALAQINLGKPADSNFSNSDMLMYRDYESVNYSFVNGENLIFDLPRTINVYGDKKNHIQVWLEDFDGESSTKHWRPLIAGVDYDLSYDRLSLYTFVSFNNVTAQIHIRWYPINSASFVPPSAVKLGLLKPFIPAVLSNVDVNSDGTQGNPVIIGHDGSIHVLQQASQDFVNRSSSAFSIEDATIWELETRIYSNLNTAYDITLDHNEIMPNANRSTPYTYNDLVTAMEPEFLKWKTRNNISRLTTDDYYDGNNKFTWNYNTVAPYIGGYRGIYTYFFNTDRPHVAPWEMLGHNKKPTWWDDYYTWLDTANGGDDVKRAALIEALRFGHHNNPDDNRGSFNINYCYCEYDWDANILVNVDGTLNDPITAGVVSTPALDKRAVDFVFGDYGPVENMWRNSSYFHGSNIMGLMRLRPLWVLNSYFDSNRRAETSNVNLNNTQIIFNNTKLLGNYKDADISYVSYDDSIIEYITVRNGGSNYTETPTLEIYENFGRDAVAVAVVRNEAIVAVSVRNPGEQYYSKPSVVASSGSATFDTFLLRGAKKYFNGLCNAIVEFAIFNKTTVTDLKQRFNSLTYAPIIKANGFINPNNQQFILESSQNKGRVVIPEENYNSVLYTTQPDCEIFLGAVKITKAYNGYVITGYDNSKQYFNYYVPNTGTRQTIITYNNLSVNKYRSFNSIPQRLYYNTTLSSIQEVYDVILGYGKYLNDQGWADTWADAAGNFVIWSSTAQIGSTTNIIPDANSITVNEGTTGYFDNINNKYDGVYNLIDSNGRQLTTNKVLIVREFLETDNPVTTITAKDAATEIYGVRLYKVNLEHAVVFDNATAFDDVIYNAALGQLHNRIIWKGSRTKEWNGRLYSPGYIVNDNTIINNFDTTAREIDQLYAQGTIVNNKQMIDLTRFNAGYNKPDWAIQLNTDDNIAFNFMQGTRKYRGTKFALDAFMRNTSLFGLAANAELNENWAIRTADYGDVRGRETLEFQLYTDLIKTNPQPIRFSAVDTPDVLTDIVIDVDVNSPLLVTGTTGNNFTTRPAKTYNNTTISQEQVYANDFITAGLPLTTETDYKVLNWNDFAVFPVANKPDYDFSGSWTSIGQWDNKTSYKYKDRVIYRGHVWEMLDPDGSSGLYRPNNPIEVTGTISLPVIPNTGQTLIIDGTTITISRVSTATTFNTITIDGINDIGTTAVVPHGSTVILGTTSDTAQTITFTSTTSTVNFDNIVIVGDVVNPQVVGSSTKRLTLDGTDILFNDIETTTNNITAKAGFEDAFNTTWTVNNTSVNRSSAATARITAIENLRNAYTGSWAAFLSTYFSDSNAGLNIIALLAEYNASPSYTAELEALVASDLTIINNIENPGTFYVTADVLSGAQTVASLDITNSQTALESGVYINDITNWLETNLTTTFSTTTIVYILTAGNYKTYILSEIIDKINAAGIPNLTASTSSSRLVLTKTTLTPNNTFSFVVTSASANLEVGITTSTTTYNSTGTLNTANPNLTISQVIAQINAAGISGISASESSASALRLSINCNNSTLFIGDGNANTVIGITAGQRVASTTVTNVQVTSDLSTIIDEINTSSIYGVTARSSNNKLKLISTNSTLTIGAGTANSTVGFTAQTYTATATTVSNVFNAIAGSDGNQVFQQMDYDPNLFSIWVADNSNSDEEYDGYAVYQSMDFGMYIYNACAGITAADDAQITVVMPTGVAQKHNLIINDYVLIRGSTTVPSIDGIHKVTGVKSDNTFYIDVYLEEEGGTGNIYPLRNVRFSSYTDLLANYNSTVNGIYKYNFSGFRQNNTLNPVYAFVDNDDTGSPAVYCWKGAFNNSIGNYSDVGWLKVRTSLPQARNDLIKNVKIFDSRRLQVQLETWDPAKGIIPGFINSEIDFKTTADFANYNYDNINGYLENTKVWNEDQVGKRWWDISTAMYLDYEQGNIDYQQNNWGRLFDGASIDIYEWTRSPVLPDQWQSFVANGGSVSGIAASGDSYYVMLNGEKIYQWTEDIAYNPRTNSTTTTYYFWVKNKTTYSNNRHYNVYQLATILRDPGAFDIAWCAASGSDYLFISNIDGYVKQNTVVQVNQLYESNALALNEWTLLSDSDKNTPIPEQLHIKMRDNIVGYNLNTERYMYVNYSLLDTYYINDVVLQDGKYYISLGENIGISPVLDTAQAYWRRIYEFNIPTDTSDTDIDIVISKTIPDLNLHPMNRYGHLIRPQQSLFEDITEARHNFIEYTNYLLKDICLVSDVNNWDVVLDSTYVDGMVTYDISKYWNYKDWIKREYSLNDELLFEYDPTNLADIIVDSKFDLIPQLGDTTVYEEDTYAYVRNAVHKDNINRPEVYRYVNSEWVLVWKKKGTIEFSEELWYQSKFGHGFDTVGFDVTGFDSCLGNILGKIFDELRYRIFTGKNRIMYNKLWFACLNSALADDTTDDFAFKTTYVDIKVEHPVLENKLNYARYSMDAVEQFFNSIKPFHTKLRSSIESLTYNEISNIEITELGWTNNITISLNDHRRGVWAGDEILSGGEFAGTYVSEPYAVSGYIPFGYVEEGVYVASEDPLNEDTSMFTTTEFDYLYDGNSFIQTVEEGWGAEVYPGNFTENVRFRVQTNASGDVVDADTRTFQMNYFAPYELEESIAIVDDVATTLDGELTANATTITVVDGSTLTQLVTAENKGVIWIDNERIEYDAIDGNILLYCTRGTRGTSNESHSTGAKVIDGGYLYRVPTLDNFVDYGNGLRMAYNDTGVSLSTTGITPEHAFIRNAGFGTI